MDLYGRLPNLSTQKLAVVVVQVVYLASWRITLYYLLQRKRITGPGMVVHSSMDEDWDGLPIALTAVERARTRTLTLQNLHRLSAWNVIAANGDQGLMQVLSSRLRLIRADPRYLAAPTAINRTMAWALTIFDLSEDEALAYRFPLSLEMDYICDHWHCRTYYGMVGENWEHDPDIVRDRFAEFQSLREWVEEFVVIALTVGAQVFPGMIHGSRSVVANSIQGHLGYRSGRQWPNVVVNPELIIIDVVDLLSVMIDTETDAIFAAPDRGQFGSESETSTSGVMSSPGSNTGQDPREEEDGLF